MRRLVYHGGIIRKRTGITMHNCYWGCLLTPIKGERCVEKKKRKITVPFVKTMRRSHVRQNEAGGEEGIEVLGTGGFRGPQLLL